MTHLTKRLPGQLLAAGALLAVSAADARAQALEKLTIVIFTPPSLGALLPPVIKAQKFDEKNGLDITVRRSGRPTPMPRSSTPASSRSAAAPR